jgi:hypothetical protein
MPEPIKIGGTMRMEELMLGVSSSRSRGEKNRVVGEGVVEVRAD